MDKELIQSLTKDFESYATEVEGVECWFARDLQEPLGYDKWDNFQKVIQKAKIACENAGNIQNNSAIRKTLLERGVKPENLPPEEDLKKLERRFATEDKKSLKQSKTLKRPERKN